MFKFYCARNNKETQRCDCPLVKSDIKNLYITTKGEVKPYPINIIEKSKVCGVIIDDKNIITDCDYLVIISTDHHSAMNKK